MKCGICGQSDLFTEVAQEPACAMCVLTYGLRVPVEQAQLERVRAALAANIRIEVHDITDEEACAGEFRATVHFTVPVGDK